MCSTFEEVVHRTIFSLVGLGLVALTVASGVTLYRPHTEQFVALYWTIFACIVAQAVALQLHGCFDAKRAWLGALSATFSCAMAAVTLTLWVRYTFECSVECHSAAATLDKPTLLLSSDVHHAAQFTSLVAAVSIVACSMRWLSVHCVRQSRLEFDERRRRGGQQSNARRPILETCDSTQPVMEMDTVRTIDTVDMDVEDEETE